MPVQIRTNSKRETLGFSPVSFAAFSDTSLTFLPCSLFVQVVEASGFRFLQKKEGLIEGIRSGGRVLRYVQVL